MQTILIIMNYFSLTILILTIIYRSQVIKKGQSSEKVKNTTLLLQLSSLLFTLTLLNVYVLYNQDGQYEIIMLPILYVIIFSSLCWMLYYSYKNPKSRPSPQIFIPTILLFTLFILTIFATALHFENIFYIILCIGIVGIFMSVLFLLKHQSFKELPRIWKFVLSFGILFLVTSYEVITSAPTEINSEPTASTSTNTDSTTTDDSVDEETTAEEPITSDSETEQDTSVDTADVPDKKIYDQTEKYYGSYSSLKLQKINKKIELAPNFFYEIDQIEIGEVTDYKPFVKKFMFDVEPTSVLKVDATVQNNTSIDCYYSFAGTFINNGINEYSPVGKFTLDKSYNPDADLPLLKAGMTDKGSFYVFMEESADTLTSLDFLIGLPTDPATGDPIDSSSDNSITIELP
ncbi:hypothetical protein AS033_10925 [Exiguobacterium indicum]|uniref:DUF4352 domain-containing protein n=1 Tax=Exiguobacterium indicum TaxID=296995 RepID=A0A0V8GF78_9BACL|nr:hypothetical protein [Exiguobacterium enclense]KSU48833.1 hypothetical protein AS033_10925 [Exiguobacterium enclense]SDC87048.1 hypothetical protein SAMN05216342_2226 [Exiguobacterium enclense]